MIGKLLGDEFTQQVKRFNLRPDSNIFTQKVSFIILSTPLHTTFTVVLDSFIIQ
jgi:hypothetical protein